MDRLFQALREQADPVQAGFMAAYMKHRFAFMGIKTPTRRRLFRPYLKELKKQAPHLDFVRACYKQPEREFQYIAIDYLIAIKNRLHREDVPFLQQLITTKSWWDSVDGLDEIIGDIHLREDLTDILLVWSVHEDMWLRRVAIDHQLQFKDRTDPALLAQIIENNLGSTEFFINKAIGWSLREYAKREPDWVRHFVETHPLSALSKREALKHL